MMPIAAVRDIDGEKVTNVVGRCPLDPTLRVSSSRSCHFHRNAARPPLCRDAPLCTNAGHRLQEGHRASSTLLVVSQLRRTDLFRHPATCDPLFGTNRWQTNRPDGRLRAETRAFRAVFMLRGST